MTRRAFDEEHEALAQTVTAVALATSARARAGTAHRRPSSYEVARFQASWETEQDLDSAADASLAWARGTTVP
jgi:hypothetical protein